jgi:hypothetical protein
MAPQNRYESRSFPPMCFGYRKTSKILRAMTPSWSAHGTLYLCLYPWKTSVCTPGCGLTFAVNVNLKVSNIYISFTSSL